MTLAINNIINRYYRNESSIVLLWLCVVTLSLASATYVENPLFGLIPFGILFAAWTIKNYTSVYFLFFLLLPFSVEYNFTPSLGTDLPTEPLMLIMTGICVLLFCQQWYKIKSSRYFNPVTFLLVLHVAWFFITTVLSENIYLSTKVFLAKIWYVIPFYFLSIHILKEKKDVEKLIVSGVYTLTISILYVLIRHYKEDFDFDEINHAVQPIFRNHVNYACIVVIFLPYLWTLYKWAKPQYKPLFIVMLIIYAAGIYYSYTRAAIIAMVLMVGVYYIVQLRLVKQSLMAVLLVGTIGISYLMYNDNYLRMNPEYNKTISHHDFNQLIDATYKMEDISTMERVYRWVAGVQMIKAKPLFGFGPGTFYTTYSAYTVTAFKTYVSDNPDQSTVHCYYLLTFIEQGFIGFILFCLLCAVVLIKGENKYHRLTDKKDKAIIMAAIMSFVVILLIILINDMIETDKVGPFFFMAMALIGGYKSVVKEEQVTFEK